MATRTNNNTHYYINPAYLTFVENSGYGANLIQVSASSSCYIRVFIPGVIKYDADGNYRRWKVTAYNNKFPDDIPAQRGKWFIYVRMEKEGTSALVIYDQVERGVHGAPMVEKTDDNGNVTKVEGEYDEEKFQYYYIHIGEVGPTSDAKTDIREISYDTGRLESDQVKTEGTQINEMWELDKFATPWLIRAKQWLADFVLKGFITLVGGIKFSKGIHGDEKEVVDIKRSIDEDEEGLLDNDSVVPSALYVKEKIEGLDNKFLRKDRDDRSEFKIASNVGFEVGYFVDGLVGGSGAKLYKQKEDDKTILKVDKIEAREELIVPVITYNCIDVISGEQVSTFAFGTIKSVDTESQTAELDLLEGQRGTVHVGDFCRGLFHFLEGNSYEDLSVDQNNFHTYSGFTTSYFKPVEILKNEPGVLSFKYELQEGTLVHPTSGMNFFAYGNDRDSGRRSITYSTREYKRRLVKVDDWKIVPDNNIAMQDGNLEGLVINGMEMHGYGTYQDNSYFTGVQIQFTNEQLEDLKGQDSYSVSLTESLGIVKKGPDGNYVYGEYTPPPGMSADANYLLQTKVEALKGSVDLEYSNDPSEGQFFAKLVPVGCDASVENGIVSVLKITDISLCYVNIEINLEGLAKRNLSYQIMESASGDDGQDAVVYSISPENSIVSRTSTGSLIPNDVTFTSYRTVGASKAKIAAYWHIKYYNESKDAWDNYFNSNGKQETFNLSQLSLSRLWKIFTTKGYAEDSELYGEAAITVVLDGADGNDAQSDASSSLLYNCLEYDEFSKYYYNKERRDVVLYGGQVYVVKNFNPEGFVRGKLPTNDEFWQQASKDIFRAMDTALIDKANIAGFVFNSSKIINGVPVGKLESQYGTQIIQHVSKTVTSGSVINVTVVGSYISLGKPETIEKTKSLAILKIENPTVNVSYKLKPSKREFLQEERYLVSCVIQYSNSLVDLSYLPSGLSMTYEKDGVSYMYEYGEEIDVTGASKYVYFRLYYGNTEIGRQTIPIGFVGLLHVDNEIIALPCNSEGEVTGGLPVPINPLLTVGTSGTAEITSVKINAPSGVEISQSKMILDAETGTISCNNVELSGYIDAIGGSFRNIKVESAIIEKDKFQANISPESAEGCPGISWRYENSEHATIGLWYYNGFVSGNIYLSNNSPNKDVTQIYPNRISLSGIPSGQSRYYYTEIGGGTLDLTSPATTSPVSLYVDTKGRAVLYSPYWATAGDVGKNCIYVDGSGYVRVKNPSRTT